MSGARSLQAIGLLNVEFADALETLTEAAKLALVGNTSVIIAALIANLRMLPGTLYCFANIMVAPLLKKPRASVAGIESFD
jgi:hypothetical protein